jgi:hypothetical protein
MRKAPSVKAIEAFKPEALEQSDAPLVPRRKALLANHI